MRFFGHMNTNSSDPVLIPGTSCLHKALPDDAEIWLAVFMCATAAVLIVHRLIIFCLERYKKRKINKGEMAMALANNQNPDYFLQRHVTHETEIVNGDEFMDQVLNDSPDQSAGDEPILWE